MYFSQNIKLLRKRRNRTQEELAHILGMKRSTLSGYENEVAEPGIQALVAISKYFGVAVDTLIRVPLDRLSESQLSELERGNDVFLRGSNLRVLATTVDENNEENIELVNEKAIFYKNKRWNINNEIIESTEISSTIVDILLKRISHLDKEEMIVLSFQSN